MTFCTAMSSRYFLTLLRAKIAIHNELDENIFYAQDESAFFFDPLRIYSVTARKSHILDRLNDKIFFEFDFL